MRNGIKRFQGDALAFIRVISVSVQEFKNVFRKSLCFRFSAKVQLTTTNSLDQMSVLLRVCVRVRKRKMETEKDFPCKLLFVLFGSQTSGSQDEKAGQHQVYAN